MAILDTYIVGNEPIYGLKTKDTIPPKSGYASSVLLPTNPAHTRSTFARQKQKQILLDFAKKVEKEGYTTQGAYGKKCLLKINQCTRIIENYLIYHILPSA